MMNVLTIFKQFFLLGWISFGGPAAHIGYFRTTFVDKLNWLSDKDYAQLVALSQFLPGPGSSQVGFALGYQRGGLAGAIAAFCGFTLPSVLLMLALAILSNSVTDSTLFQGVIHGLKLLAVVVVADATLSMAGNFCRTKLTSAIAVATAAVLLFMPGLWSQTGVLILAAISGFIWLKSRTVNLDAEDVPEKTSVNAAHIPLILFVVLLFGLPLLAHLSLAVKIFSDFYQAGSLVFGGGHVVLPLLQNIVGDQLGNDSFITGYAAAQAVPGPMFTLATYLGYQLLPETPIIGALIATAGVFLPGFLLLLGVLKNWHLLAENPSLSGAINGVNAAVVGLLLSALYQPVFISAVHSATDFALVISGFFLLRILKLPIMGLVGLAIIGGVLESAF
ncbi:chromate efflux transporter [Amphritea atlantica]|uniref:Chromate efflux transporter n=1 Tax=Amphritea atlantica TaxID=355243 RepID=A0ABY5GVX3_9GAMM|nr:chromate efflux transporter [Amphritea atlantica]